MRPAHTPVLILVSSALATSSFDYPGSGQRSKTYSLAPWTRGSLSMRYHSNDYNCLIDILDDTPDDQNRRLADITVVYPCLVESRLCETTKTIVLSSKSSRTEICSISFPSGCPSDLRSLKLDHMSRIRVEIRDDALLESESSETSSQSFFGVRLPSDDGAHDQVGVDQICPEIETQLLHLVTQRKRQDENEIREFTRKKKASFDSFEAEVNAQATILSALALSSTVAHKNAVEKQQSSSTAPECKQKAPRRLSTTSVHSSSSASSDKPKKKLGKHAKRNPTRSATAPVPKPVLITAVRKSSLSEIKKDGQPSGNHSKRVMFSEQEPTRIDSPHVLDPTDTEDDPIEHEDLFDMDETIPVVPIASQVPAPVDIPGTASLEVPSVPRIPFGRQEDTGLSGSFRLRSLDKYGPIHKSPEDLVMFQRDISEAEASPFATSLPRNIGISEELPISAPLSSVKHLMSLSPTQADLESDPLDNLGDSPPAGMSRKTMWTKAVASSLRMSGLVLPTMQRDEIESSIVPPRRQPLRG